MNIAEIPSYLSSWLVPVKPVEPPIRQYTNVGLVNPNIKTLAYEQCDSYPVKTESLKNHALFKDGFSGTNVKNYH